MRLRMLFNGLLITDTKLIDNRYKVGWPKADGRWKDTGKPEDILEGNRLILEDIQTKKEGTAWNLIIVRRSIIEKGVKIKDSIVKDSIVKEPVIIGKDSMIRDSYIGPYTSIGSNCVIDEAEIEDSIIMDGSEIIRGELIIKSLMGKGVKIRRKVVLPNGRKLIVGDNSEIVW